MMLTFAEMMIFIDKEYVMYMEVLLGLCIFIEIFTFNFFFFYHKKKLTRMSST